MNPNTRKTFVLVSLLALLGVAFAGCLGGDNPGGGTAQGVKTACPQAATTNGGNNQGTNNNSTNNTSSFMARDAAPSLEEQLREAAAALQQGTTLNLRIGTLLPLTGNLAAYGPDMERATQLARDHINNATGGGITVTLHHQDSRTDATHAPSAFDTLKNQGVTGIVGAASSGVTASILDRAKTEKVIVVTPASTSPSLTDRDNGGYFFRVPPSDALQGKVLANLVYDHGCRSVAILAVNNPYGQGLGKVFSDSFKARGGNVVADQRYNPTETNFGSIVQQATQGNPDAVVLIGYPEEGSKIVQDAYQNGALSRSVWFFSEGLYDRAFVDLVGKDSAGNFILAGLQGTTPKSAENNATAEFNNAFNQRFGKQPGLFAAESYDAVWAIALAAAKAGSTNAEQVKNHMLSVWNSPGPKVTGSNATLLLTLAKTEVDYVGAAGDFDWDNKGDPVSGIYAYWKVGTNGDFTTTRENVRAE